MTITENAKNDNSKMEAYVKKSFSGGFIMSAEDFSYIHNKIIDRINNEYNETDTICEFKVYRADKALFTTNDHNSVMAEENTASTKILRIDMTYKNEGLHARLSIDKEDTEDPIEFLIKCENKNLAVLLAGEIESALEDKVLKVFSHGNFQKLSLFLTLFMLFGLMAFTAANTDTSPAVHPDDLVRAIESTDTNFKVNTILKGHLVMAKKQNLNPFDPLISFIFIFSFAGMLIVSKGIWNLVYPLNIFRWGDEEKKYKARKGIISKVFWVVLVGILVSLAATFIAANLNK